MSEKPNNGQDTPSYSLEEILAEFRTESAAGSGKTRPYARLTDEPPVGKRDKAEERLAALETMLDELGKDHEPVPPMPSVHSKPEIGEEAASGPDTAPDERSENPPIIEDKQAVAWNRAETPPPMHPPAGQTASIEVKFGGLEELEKHLTPSHEYSREEPEDDADLPDDPPPKAKTSVGEKIRKRAREAATRTTDIPVKEAAQKLRPYVRSLGLRTAAAFVLNLPLAYITFSHRFDWPVPEFASYVSSPFLYLFTVLALQILIMLVGVDVIGRGLGELFHFRPSSDSAVSMACLASLLHVLSVIVLDGWSAYLPYCAVSGAAVFVSMWSQYLRAKALERGYRAAALSDTPQVVLREENAFDGLAAFFRREQTPEGFVEQAEADDLVKRFYTVFIPIVLVASLVLALLSTVGQGRPKEFFWAWAAISSCTAPFSGMIAFTLPFALTAKRLASSGAALAGWTGARAMADGELIVLNDADVFPPGSVTINSLKVFGTHSFDKVISYAASLVAASGGGLQKPFLELLKGQSEAIRQVMGFEHYEGGGVGAEISGDRVLLGSYNFMVRMGVPISKGLNIKNAVFVAINLDTAGVFAMGYAPLSSVRRTLQTLRKHDVLPLFAVRDFNITPQMIKHKFKLPDELAEFPTIEDRLSLSDPARVFHGKPLAVISREGVTPFGEALVGGIRLRKLCRVHLWMSLTCLLTGLLLMFYLVFSGTTLTAMAASPCNVLLFQLLWMAPCLLLSGWTARY